MKANARSLSAERGEITIFSMFMWAAIVVGITYLFGIVGIRLYGALNFGIGFAVGLIVIWTYWFEIINFDVPPEGKG